MSGYIRDIDVHIRKPRQCFGCLKKIAIGSLMNCQTSKDCGQIFNTYVCEECLKIPSKIIGEVFAEDFLDEGYANILREEGYLK
ncbi:MAG: hypothetical protein KBA81_06910 [Rhabdochlamydiaceae bacterium]|nr:hypothetical protein [Rhabdochlamydiaceae bacterium]